MTTNDLYTNTTLCKRTFLTHSSADLAMAFVTLTQIQVVGMTLHFDMSPITMTTMHSLCLDAASSRTEQTAESR